MTYKIKAVISLQMCIGGELTKEVWVGTTESSLLSVDEMRQALETMIGQDNAADVTGSLPCQVIQ